MPPTAPMTTDDRALIAWLGEHDETCPLCRYNLRGLTTPTCPECRASLRLSVGAPNLRFGAWIFAMIAFALGLGFDGVMCVTMTIGGTIEFIQQGGGPVPWMFVRILMTLGLLGAGSLAGLLLVLRVRRRWLVLPARRQWLLAGAIFVGVGVVHAAAGLSLVL